MIDSQPGAIATPEGREIGEVKDFILNLDAGRIAYVIGAFNQSAQFRNKLFVIPWGIVKLDSEQTMFTLVGDGAALEGAPNFSPTAWPDRPLSQWTSIVDKYWQGRQNSSVVKESGPHATLYKAGDLLGLTIQSTTQKNVGTIEELLLTPETGAIAYVLLSAEEVQKSHNKTFFVLPWSIVQVNIKQHLLAANIDKKDFTKIRKILCDNVDSGRLVEACRGKGIRTQNQ